MAAFASPETGRGFHIRRATKTLKQAAAALAVLTMSYSLGAAQDAGLTGSDITGPVTVQMVSCCKTTYFGPAVEAWNKANPDITLQQEVIPFAQLNDILEARMRSRDSSFDILIVDPPRTAAFAAKRYLKDLTATFGAKLKDTTNPDSLQAVSFRDKLYAVPVFNSTQILIYNPDMLEKAGIAAPSIDPSRRVTWEQLAADAKTIKEKLKTDYGMAFAQGHTFYQLQPIVMSAGGGAGLVGQNNLTPEVNSDAWKKAMAWYGSLYADGIAPRGVPFTQMDTLFTSGKAPFLLASSDRVRELQKQNIKFGVAAFPMFAGGKPYTSCDSFALGINPYSKHQAQAAKFLEWLSTTKDGGFAAAAESPNVPASLLVRDEVSMQMEKAGTNLAGLTDLIKFETSNTCVHRPQSIAYIQFETAFLQKNMDIINGADAAKSLDAMQNQLKTDLSRIR